jgi:hypothetical protein
MYENMTRWLCLWMVGLSWLLSGYAISIQEKNYYVVIHVDSALEEAMKHTDEANSKGFNAQYVLHSDQRYYVFLFQSTDKKKAETFRRQIRKETEYKKSWIYSGRLGET